MNFYLRKSAQNFRPLTKNFQTFRVLEAVQRLPRAIRKCHDLSQMHFKIIFFITLQRPKLKTPDREIALELPIAVMGAVAVVSGCHTQRLLCCSCCGPCRGCVVRTVGITVDLAFIGVVGDAAVGAVWYTVTDLVSLKFHRLRVLQARSKKRCQSKTLAGQN